MRVELCAAAWIMAALGASGAAAPPELPVVDGHEAVALVNGEPVPLDAVRQTVLEIEADVARGAGKPQEPWEVLERFVTVKLLVQEARNIGFHEDEGFRRSMEAFRNETLRNMLLEAPARRVERVDGAEVTRRVRLATGEARIASVVFDDRAEAEAFLARVEAAADFEAQGKAAVASGRARASEDAGWARLGDLRPEVARALAGLEPGGIAGPIPVESAHTLVKLHEWKVPDDPAARERAESDALGARRLAEVTDYTAELRARYAKVDEALLEKLDFDAPEPGFAALAKDERVIAEIAGGEPVTVRDLARALEPRFFHGTQRAAEKKRINRLKRAALDEIVLRRIALLEARRLGLDKSRDYLEAVAEQEEDLLFATFVERVIRPGLTPTEDEIRRYFDGHREEFKGPETLSIDALAFERREDAERAVARLRAGADFEWVRRNVEGLLAPGDPRVTLELPRAGLARADLPEGVRAAVEGATKGDLRIHHEPGQPAYLLRIAGVTAPQLLPLEAAREAVARRVVQERTRGAVKEWTARLRESYEVEMFVTPESLAAAIARPADPGP